MNKRLECTLINAVDEADAVRKRGRAERPEPALWHVSQPQYGHQQPPQQQYATASGAAQTRARTCNSGGHKREGSSCAGEEDEAFFTTPSARGLSCIRVGSGVQYVVPVISK